MTYRPETIFKAEDKRVENQHRFSTMIFKLKNRRQFSTP